MMKPIPQDAPQSVLTLASVLEQNIRNDGMVDVVNPEDHPCEHRPAWLSRSGFVIFKRTNGSHITWFIFYPTNVHGEQYIVFNFFDGQFGGITTASRDALLDPWEELVK